MNENDFCKIVDNYRKNGNIDITLFYEYYLCNNKNKNQLDNQNFFIMFNKYINHFNINLELLTINIIKYFCNKFNYQIIITIDNNKIVQFKKNI
jgi:hypothetical protein